MITVDLVFGAALIMILVGLPTFWVTKDWREGRAQLAVNDEQFLEDLSTHRCAKCGLTRSLPRTIARRVGMVEKRRAEALLLKKERAYREAMHPIVFKATPEEARASVTDEELDQYRFSIRQYSLPGGRLVIGREKARRILAAIPEEERYSYGPELVRALNAPADLTTRRKRSPPPHRPVLNDDPGFRFKG